MELVRQLFAETPAPGAPCVGHVSLQTYRGGENGEGVYASYWPEDHHSTPISKKGIKGGLVGSLERDKELEYLEPGIHNINVNIAERKKSPDKIIELNGLDIDAINQAFQEFKSNIENINWSLWGSVYFRKKQTRNCASLAEYLLEKGGFYSCIKKNKQLNPYSRLAWRTSMLATATFNGLLLGSIVNGKRGAITYGSINFLYALTILRLSSINSTAEKHGLANATFGSMMGGMPPVQFWAIVKGIKIGYRLGLEKNIATNTHYWGIGGGACGLLTGLLLGGLVGLIGLFPINFTVGAIAACLNEGTGLVLTPTGLLQLAEYAEQGEKSQEHITKEIFPSLGIDSNTLDNIKMIVGFVMTVISMLYILSYEIDDTITVSNPFRMR